MDDGRRSATIAPEAHRRRVVSLKALAFAWDYEAEGPIQKFVLVALAVGQLARIHDGDVV